MPFLIFNTYEDAIARNDEAGKSAGLAFHRSGKADGTRYVWTLHVEESNNPRAALDIDRRENLLTTDEAEHLVDELPDDWEYSND